MRSRVLNVMRHLTGSHYSSKSMGLRNVFDTVPLNMDAFLVHLDEEKLRQLLWQLSPTNKTKVKQLKARCTVMRTYTRVIVLQFTLHFAALGLIIYCLCSCSDHL